MTSSTNASRELLAQADMLLLLADLLRRPGSVDLPEPEQTIELLDAAFPEVVNGRLRDDFLALFACAKKTPLIAWSDEYHRLFEGPIACPINETTYMRRDKGAIIADVCGFYRAFGFEPSPDAGEKPDHLRCELEFFAALTVMEAQAIEQQLHEQSQITGEAVRRFAADHLADWLDAFCARLVDVTSLAVYGRLAEVLPLVWQSLADRRHLPKLRPGNPDDGEHEEIELDPMPCGGGQVTGQSGSIGQDPCDLTVNGVRPASTSGGET